METTCANCGHEFTRHVNEGGPCNVEFCPCGRFKHSPPDYLTDKEHAKPDMVDHPAHYTDGEIEVWDYIIDKNLTYCLGNVVKYVSRAGKKDPSKHIEDLKKAKAYLDREIKRVESGAAEESYWKGYSEAILEANQKVIQEEINDPKKVIGVPAPEKQVVFADRFTPQRAGKQRQMICDQCWQAVKFKNLTKHVDTKHPESNGYQIAVG